MVLTVLDMGSLEALARTRIVRWRKQYGWSQAKLGATTGTHQTTVGKWEKGDLSVDVDTLDTWARAFGRTLFDLFAQETTDTNDHRELIAVFNALPTDALREQMLQLMRLSSTGAGKPPSRGGKRGG